MTAQILGLGIAAPHCSVPRDRSIRFAQSLLFNPGTEARALPALYRMTFVKNRGSVLVTGEDAELGVVQDFYPRADSHEQRGPSTQERSERYASEVVPLAIRACSDAIADAKIDATSLTHIVIVTCTGFYAPGVDIELIETLNLNPEIERVQVGFMGCHGAINGLRVARGLIAADADAKVLLVSVELCSLHYQYGWEPNRVVSNAIFADGSGAVILTSSNDTSCLPQINATGSRLVADSKDAMTWKIGNFGYEMTLSAEVPGLIEAKLLDFISRWLNKHQLTIGEIRGWAVHPGGPRILTAVEKALSLPEQALACSRTILAEHGNMSSATMLFILRRFIDHNLPRPWLMLGFGPGLEIEVALLR